jgi:hypothetical protein
VRPSLVLPPAVRLLPALTAAIGLLSGCRGELLTLGQAPVVTSASTTTTFDAAPPTDTTVLPVSGGRDAMVSPITADAMGVPVVPVDAATPAVAPGDVMDASSTSTVDALVPATFRAPRVLEPEVVPIIGSDDKDDNPTLTADLLEIYFTSTRSGDSDVWVAKRTSADSDFNEPEQVAIVNSTEFESSPAIESDGLTLWVARREEDSVGGLDVYVSRRPTRDDEWSPPELVTGLSSPGDDIPRPPGAGGLLMPLSSRAEGDTYHLYVATRQDSQSDFGAPMVLEPLLRDDYGTVDGFVTWDGEHLLFSYTQEDVGDLFITRRNGNNLTDPLPLSDINTDSDERDPWVSADGKLLFFASDRDDSLRIYQAHIEWD